MLEESGLPVFTPEPFTLPGVTRYDYMNMPLHRIFVAAWFRVFGPGVLPLRSFTILCGVAILFVWFVLILRLTLDTTIAVAATAVLSVDYNFVLRSSEGRMDALSAAFGFGALALYLTLRERHFAWAVLGGNALVAASAWTHPNGGILAFAGLALLTLYCDRRRIRWRYFALALLPYLVAIGAWAWYISQDFESFRGQFIANAFYGGRLDTGFNPLRNIVDEITGRYLASIGGWDSRASLLGRAKLPVLFAYWGALAGVCSIAALRNQKGIRALLFLTGVYAFVLAFTDGRKSQCYLIHVVPMFTALMAVLGVWLWRTRARLRLPLAAVSAMLLLIHAGGIVFQVRSDAYHRLYIPVVEFLRTHVQPDQIVIGSSTLGLGLNYPPNLIADIRVGQRSKKNPEWVVVNTWYRDAFQAMREKDPEAFAFIQNRLDTQFEVVYENAEFTVYHRFSSPGT